MIFRGGKKLLKVNSVVYQLPMLQWNVYARAILIEQSDNIDRIAY